MYQNDANLKHFFKCTIDNFANILNFCCIELGHPITQVLNNKSHEYFY